jgi:hypothetical protein
MTEEQKIVFAHLALAAYSALLDTTASQYRPAAVCRFLHTVFVEI